MELYVQDSHPCRRWLEDDKVLGRGVIPSSLSTALSTTMMPPSSPLLLAWLQSLLILRLTFKTVNDLLEWDFCFFFMNMASLCPMFKPTTYSSQKQEVIIWNSWNLPSCAKRCVFFKGGDHKFHQILKVISYLKKRLLFS